MTDASEGFDLEIDTANTRTKLLVREEYEWLSANGYDSEAADLRALDNLSKQRQQALELKTNSVPGRMPTLAGRPERCDRSDRPVGGRHFAFRFVSSGSRARPFAHPLARLESHPTRRCPVVWWNYS